MSLPQSSVAPVNLYPSLGLIPNVSVPPFVVDCGDFDVLSSVPFTISKVTENFNGLNCTTHTVLFDNAFICNLPSMYSPF